MTRARIARAVALATLAIFAWVAQGQAQSLAEVARREAERRESVIQPSKVYTNSSLTPDFTTPPRPAEEPTEAALPESPSGEPVAESASVEPQSLVTPADQQEPPPPYDKGEEYWRGQAERIRGRLNRQHAELLNLRQRLDSLGDAQGSERDIVSGAIRKAEAALQSFDQEWRRFELQAKARNVPDAWIR